MHQVLQLLAYRLRVPEVVVLLEQPVEQRLLGRAAHLAQLQHTECAQRRDQRRLVGRDRRGLLALDQVVAADLAHRRQLDQAATVQHQHQAAADHVPRRAVGLHPVPGLTELLR